MELAEDTLSIYDTDWEVIRELHGVPPYRVYEIVIDDRRAVLKVNDHPRGHAAEEGRVQEYVVEETSAGVPGILAVGSDHYIMAWVDEIADASEGISTDWARAAGNWMATLHSDTAGVFDGFGYLRDKNRTLELNAHEQWIDAVLGRVGHHRQFLDSKGYGTLLDSVETFFGDHSPTVFNGVGVPVLCHGDVHPEHHVRNANGEVIGIDFNHSLVAPAEYDYWRTVMPYFEANDAVSENASEAFLEGYESVRTLPDGYEERKLQFRLINWIKALTSLHLQQTVEQPKRDRLGALMREQSFEIIKDLRELVG